jgi:hypothetical protein
MINPLAMFSSGSYELPLSPVSCFTALHRTCDCHRRPFPTRLRNCFCSHKRQTLS